MNSIIEILNYAKSIGILSNLILTVCFTMLLFGIFAVICYKGYKKWIAPMKNKMLLEHDTEQEKEEVIESHGKEIAQLREEMLNLQSQVNEAFNDVKAMTEKIIHYNSAQTEVIKTQIRHAIVRAAQEAIGKGFICTSELKSLEELNEKYMGDLLKGNSYVHILMQKVEQLEIIPDGTEEYIKEHSEK